MNMYKWLDDLLESKVKKPLPVLSFPGVQLLGITVRELVENAENQANCMKIIADKFDCAASVSLMDLSVEAECFGSEIAYSDDEVPTVTNAIVNDEEDADQLKVPAVGTMRTATCVKAIEKSKELITDRPVLAGVIGPFSLAGRLMDMTEIMVNCLVEPELTHTVLSKVTDFILQYTLELKKAGADGVVMAEPAAGLISPDTCDEFSSKYVKKIVDAVQDENFIVVYHNCGNTVPLIDTILSVGAKAYHFGNAVDIVTILEKMPKDIPVMGNLSPADYFRNGNPESVKAATLEMLERTKDYKNYIPSSGCDIPPASPMENIEAFFEAINEFYSK